MFQSWLILNLLPFSLFESFTNIISMASVNNQNKTAKKKQQSNTRVLSLSRFVYNHGRSVLEMSPFSVSDDVGILNIYIADTLLTPSILIKMSGLNLQ